MKNEVDIKEINVLELKTHPLADVYRMHDDEEYYALKESIKIDGIVNPVAIAEENEQYYLIDGRNRVNACKELKINDIPYAIITNMPINVYIHTMHNRRNVTKSQLAMAHALLYPEGEKRGPKANSHSKSEKSKLQVVDFKEKNKTHSKSDKFGSQILTEARYLIGGDPDKPAYPNLVKDVKYGKKSCKVAYNEAKEIERKNNFDQEILNKLKENAYDLYCKVIDDGEDLHEQYKIMQLEEKNKEKSRRSMYKVCKNIYPLLIFKYKAQRDALIDDFSNEDFVKEVGKDFEKWKDDLNTLIESLNNLIEENKKED